MSVVVTPSARHSILRCDPIWKYHVALIRNRQSLSAGPQPAACSLFNFTLLTTTYHWDDLQLMT